MGIQERSRTRLWYSRKVAIPTSLLTGKISTPSDRNVKNLGFCRSATPLYMRSRSVNYSLRTNESSRYVRMLLLEDSLDRWGSI
jgi:hypothetical protein